MEDRFILQSIVLADEMIHATHSRGDSVPWFKNWTMRKRMLELVRPRVDEML
jgi:hypothetical protein